MKDVAKVFLRLGFVAFGGPASAFILLEDEIVKRLKWIDSDTFLKNLALVKILPGPTATQLTIQLGRLYKGRWAGLIAGLCFLMPSFFLVMILGLILDFWKGSPIKGHFSFGLELGALAVICHGIYRMFRVQVKNFEGYLIVALSGVLTFFYPGLEPLFIIGFGLMGLGLFYSKRKTLEASILLLLVYVGIKAALFSFGTGLAIVPLLQTQVVEKFHLISQADFLEALALGQITPGPVVNSFAWMGYKAAGFLGAVVCTFFVFLPGFLICLFLMPLIEDKLNSSKGIHGFYNWAIYTVIGSMIAITIKLFGAHLVGPVDWALLVAALILLFWKNTPSWLIIPLFGFFAVGLKGFRLPFLT